MASLLVAAALLWLVAARRVRAARGPAAVSWGRNALFLAGLGTIAVALASPVDIGQLLAAALQRWAPVDRCWRLEPSEAAVVVGDPDRLGLALDALIENAVKYTGPGNVIRLASRRQGDQVAIIVVDSGAGMPADRLATIFERFARLDDGRSRDRGGTGLGLAIVKAIVQAHGGTVRARSAVGTGSTFELVLPLEPRPDPTSAHRGVVAGQRLQETWLHG